MAESEHPRTSEEEAELLARLEEQIRRMSVADHLVYMLESLAALCTRKLGIAPDTRSERDLDQARLAIDAFRALLQVVEAARPAQDLAAHRGMLSQLQLAYVGAMEAPAEERQTETGTVTGTGTVTESETGTVTETEDGELSTEQAPGVEAECDVAGGDPGPETSEGSAEWTLPLEH